MYWGNYVCTSSGATAGNSSAGKLRRSRTTSAYGRLLRRAPLDFDIEDFVDLTSQPEGRRSLWEAHVHALFSHKHETYSGRVTLLRTRVILCFALLMRHSDGSELAAGGVSRANRLRRTRNDYG